MNPIPRRLFLVGLTLAISGLVFIATGLVGSLIDKRMILFNLAGGAFAVVGLTVTLCGMLAQTFIDFRSER